MILRAADERDQRGIGHLDGAVHDVHQPEFDERADVIAGRVHVQWQRRRPAPPRSLDTQDAARSLPAHPAKNSAMCAELYPFRRSWLMVFS